MIIAKIVTRGMSLFIFSDHEQTFQVTTATTKNRCSTTTVSWKSLLPPPIPSCSVIPAPLPRRRPFPNAAAPLRRPPASKWRKRKSSIAKNVDPRIKNNRISVITALGCSSKETGGDRKLGWECQRSVNEIQ